ncbi:MAG: thioredoxin family protein [Candidatus Hydrogenedentes bacterium]|nr:thioredoxin family protein [Candidatus Hydrogenedentota bacterium]
MFVAAFAPAGLAQTIPWSSDYVASIEKAGTGGKPVLIDFTAVWCGWCKRLDEEVYADASAVNALKDFVCLKIDVNEQKNLALAYNVQSMPRTIVLNVHGEIVGDLTGYVPLGTFLEFIEGLKDDLTRKTGGTMKPDVRVPVTPLEKAQPAIMPDTPVDEMLQLLGDRDPKVRAEAIKVIDEKPERLQILVSALASDALGTRITAYETIRKFGGSELKFDPWAPKAERVEALTAWQRWAEQATEDRAEEVAP